MKIEEIKKAYADLWAATAAAQKANTEFETVKDALETKVLKATAEGRIIGSNEGARKAAALVEFEKEYLEKDAKEAALREANYSLAYYRNQLDCLRDCLRFEELAVANAIAYPLQTITSKAVKEKVKVITPK